MQEKNFVTIAGPGTGKTHHVISKVTDWLNKDQGNRAVVVTFTNAAAQEILDRLGDLSERVEFAGTIHGLCARIIGNDRTIITQAQKERVIDQAKKASKSRPVDKRLRQLISQGPPTENWQPTACAEHRAYMEYYSIMDREGFIDFDGLLREGMNKIVRADPDHPTYRNLLFVVDEYQDVGPSENAIAKAYPAREKYFVGDPGQAIFGFRGGDPSFLTEKVKDERYQCDTLRTTRRFGKNIASAANRFGYLLIEPDPTIEDEVVAYEPANSSLEMDMVARCAQDNSQSGTVGIICRTNKQAEEIKKALGSWSPKDDKHEEMLDRLELLLGWMAEPYNDTLASWYLEATYGPEKVKEVRREAVGFINDQYKIAAGLQAKDVTAGFKPFREDFPEAVERKLSQIADQAQEGQTITEIAIALREWRSQKPGDDSVTVTTYHGSKGREWDTVILPFWNENRFPLPYANPEEEKRLAYVGITRAKERLIITRTRELPSGAFWDELGL